MPITNFSVELYQALSLPQGCVQRVSPKLIHNEKVYAYDLIFQLKSGQHITVDVRQVPTEAIPQSGQYGEMGLYITSFAELSKIPLALGSLTCRYLGPQMSLVFFQELLDRYHLLHLQDELIPSQPTQATISDKELVNGKDGVTEFQDRYAEVLSYYHPLGFAFGLYSTVPLLETPLGTFFLGVSANEQIMRIAQPGDELFVSTESFSLASFKEL